MSRDFIRSVALALLLAAALSKSAFSQTINTDVWLEDFAQLKQEMTGHYANLLWLVQDRGLDLKQLSAETESKLRQARTEDQARQVINTFLRAFGDGHLGILWPGRSIQSSQAANAGSQPGQPPLCTRLGYSERNAAPGIYFSALNGFREVRNSDSKYFPIGILSLRDKTKIGVIRIGFFSEHIYPDLCEKASEALGFEPTSACEDCSGPIERETANLVLVALERQIRVLEQEGINALVLDVTNNDGGGNIVDPIARTLTPRPLRGGRVGFIRHKHWVDQLRNSLESVEADMRHAPPRTQKVLLHAARVYRKAISEAERSCRQEGVWQGQKPGCELVALEPPMYTTGILPYAKPGEVTEKQYPESRTKLFYPSRYRYHEGVYRGLLIVLVDRETASAAEGFASMLKDNGAAHIMGEPTYGAGCGYTNGGIETILKNSGGKVLMPDCVRMRADGTNEVAGIIPDTLIPWRANDTAFQKAKRVAAALESRSRGWSK